MSRQRKPQAKPATPQEGLRLNAAFVRITDAAVRAAIISLTESLGGAR